MFDFARLPYKTRKRWALIVLVLGVPAYVVTSVTIMNWLFPDPLDKPHVLVELAIYVGLGVIWAFPLRGLFKGIGQADPDAPPDPD